MKIPGIVVLVSCLVPVSVNAQVQAFRSFDVYDSVGVNTHWTYGSPYVYLNDFSSLITVLSKAQIHHFRDGQRANGYDTPSWVTSMYSQTNAAGLKADLIVAKGQTADQLESGLKLYPGVEAIEPPNEWDMNGGWDWASSLLAYMPAVRKAGSDLHLTVLGPSLTQSGSYGQLGDVAQFMDVNNLHAYFGGRNPETGGWGGPNFAGNYYGSIAWNLDNQNVDGPNVPVWTTETGYQTTSTPTQNQIPEWVEGTYVPRLVLKLFKEGVKRSYLYELIDDPNDVQPGYGLLRIDMSPKPAYTALSNLLSLLQDSDTEFTPESLDYSLTGQMNGVETLLLEKNNGDFYLAVWLDGSIYDVNGLVATPIAPQQLTLNVPKGSNVADVSSFNADGTVSSTSPNTSSYTVNVNSCVTLIHIRSSSTPTAVVATPTFSVPSGAYPSPKLVTISTSTAGAGIFYTMDGSTPTTSSTRYSGAITVSGANTIAAIAAAEGYVNSAVASATYAIGSIRIPRPPAGAHPIRRLSRVL